MQNGQEQDIDDDDDEVHLSSSAPKRALLSATPINEMIVDSMLVEEIDDNDDEVEEVEASFRRNRTRDGEMELDEDTRFAMELMRQEEEEFLQRIHEEQERYAFAHWRSESIKSRLT